MNSTNLVGNTLQNGKYTIKKELGRGGFGVTYQAIHHSLNQGVVVKTLRWPDNNAEDFAQQLQQFQAEARRLAQCQHANIVNVTDFFVEAERPYLVMDFIPGQPLSDLIFPDRPLAEKTALKYIRQIASALQTVHGQGLLHRDVKPQNIMIDDRTGHAILIDFGIARELTNGQTQTHTNLVSEGYAPLEQYLAKARRSPASDVYGLAATLYAAVTGQVPVASVLRSHQPLTPPRQLNPRLSPTIEQAIFQGMALELAQRPQSIATWLGLVNGKNTQPAPSQHQRSDRKRSAPGTTTQATQVVAPGSPSGYSVNELDSRSTLAAPESRTKHKTSGGPGFFKTLLSLILLGVLTGVGWGGYQLYKGAQQTLANLKEKTPDLSEVTLPEVKLPEVKIPEIEIPDLGDIVENLPTAPENEETPPAPEKSPPETGPETEPETGPATNTFDSPTLVLRNSGNSKTSAPGGSRVVTVPGFAPGTSATAIINRLGSPTRQGISAGATTAVYELAPNRATVAYVYDAAGNTVQQAEAAFAPSYDRLIMRVALAGMLNGQSTREIETGLEQVRTGQVEQYSFEHNGLTGSVERNDNGFIHIHVR